MLSRLFLKDFIVWGAFGVFGAVLSYLGDWSTGNDCSILKSMYNLEYIQHDVEVCTIFSQLVHHVKRGAVKEHLDIIVVETDRLLCIFNAIKNGSIQHPSVDERSDGYVLLTKIEHHIPLLCKKATELPPQTQADLYRLGMRLDTLLHRRWQYIMERSR